MPGLRAAVVAGFTSADVMGTFPEQVYGKTGTAQYISNGVENDYAWYACFVPASGHQPPDCRCRHRGEGRLRRRRRRAGSARRSSRNGSSASPGRTWPGRSHLAMSATPIQPVDETSAPRPRGAGR